MPKIPHSPFNILVSRPDRIGDVILSTPVFEALKRHYPQARLTVLVQRPVEPLIRGLACVDDVLIYDPLGEHAGIQGLFKLLAEIRERDYRIAVALQSHWKIAAAIFGAGVRYRVGPLSKPHSFLFYNRGVRQRRSYVEMHETDYNLQLLRRLGIRVGTRSLPVQVGITPDVQSQADAWLSERGLGGGTLYVVVHPGMGGSALNWPESHYVDFTRALLKEGRKVVITGGPEEGALLMRFQEALGDRVTLYGGPESAGVDFLGGIMSRAILVVAPSTGPLHLAVALGRPVVTFYPPIRVQSAIRWGPYVADEQAASVLVPEVYCGQDFKCLGNVCNYFPCMKSLTVAQALEEAHRQIALQDGKKNHDR